MNLQEQRIKEHCIGLSTAVIWPEITDEGCILARDVKGNIYKDAVTTHHLVDLLFTLNSSLFVGNIERACKWFISDANDTNNPFTLSTIAQAENLSLETKNKIAKAILLHRRKSGLIEIFTAFNDSGSLFSTLWAVKILLLLQNQNEYAEIILKAMMAIKERWEDLHRYSFKGFYLELIYASQIESLQKYTKKICQEIIESQNKNGLWDNSLFYSTYIAYNLLTAYSNNQNKKALDSARLFIETLFECNRKPKGIPSIIKKQEKNIVESLYLQIIIRTVILGSKLLKMQGYNVGKDIANTLLGSWPSLYNATNSLDVRLKKMHLQYGNIADEYQRHEVAAKELLSNSSYERNVFIMMPFRQQEDEQYALIEKIIKEELSRRCFTGYIATDKELMPTLWDNVASYMIGCKYGIAIFTRKENLDKGEISPDFNPNVSLELGFMLSRAKQILLLKDTFLKTLPTDIVGRLYKEFDLRKVQSQLPNIIGKWADSILEQNKTNK